MDTAGRLAVTRGGAAHDIDRPLRIPVRVGRAAMSHPSIVSGDWEGCIGRRTTLSAYLAPGPANQLAVTLDREPDLAPGDALPPGWHWPYLQDLVRASDLGDEGHPRLGIVMPPVPLPRRMWAAGSLRFEAPLVIGTTVERATTIRSIVPKDGRSGRLCFVTVEHELRSGGELRVLEEQTIVYRDAPRPGEQPPAPPAPTDARFSAAWRLDEVALFRYSAATFNAHRIHYDADYCRDVEGYPGLVVHGPLIATLLLDLAVREERPLGRFTYRARHPLFLPHGFTVNGRADGDTTSLWAADHRGGLAMEAEAAPS
jgi:3-methylfumaryl-CoA hydratase